MAFDIDGKMAVATKAAAEAAAQRTAELVKEFDTNVGNAMTAVLSGKRSRAVVQVFACITKEYLEDVKKKLQGVGFKVTADTESRSRELSIEKGTAGVQMWSTPTNC